MDKKQAFETCQANLNKKVNVKTVHGNLNGYLGNVDRNNMYLAVSGKEFFGSVPTGYPEQRNTRKKSGGGGYGGGYPPGVPMGGNTVVSPYGGANPYAYKGRCGSPPPRYPYPYRPYPGAYPPSVVSPAAVGPTAVGPAAIAPVPIPVGGVPCGIPGGYGGGYGGFGGGGLWWVAIPLAFLVGLGIGWWAR